MAAHDEPELIGVGQSQAIESEALKDGGSSAKTLLVLLVVGLIGFAMFRPSGSSSDSASENQELLGEQPESTAVESESTTTTTRRRTTTSRPSTNESSVINELGPFFDIETGWDIIVGGDGATTRLGLDSGLSEQIGVGTTPMAVVGEYLVLSNPRNDSVSYVRLDNLGGDAVRIPGARPNYGPQQPVVADIVDGRIWLLGGPWESQLWQLWELGEEPVAIRELQAPINNFGPAAAHPEVIGASSGGVFVYEGDRITKVADGRLMTVSNTHAVVEQCESPFDCETVWFDLESWEVDTRLRTPQVQNPYFLFLMVVSPNSKFAFVYDFGDQSMSGALWNLETGVAEFDGFSEEGAGFSPDGRFAAGFLRSGDVAIIDTETGELVEVDLPGVHGYGRIVFAPSS